MQGTPFDEALNCAPLTFPFETDTSTPRSVVPIYFIHTPQQPFCANPFCECHRDQTQIALLVEAIQQGEMTLREAADFADGRCL